MRDILISSTVCVLCLLLAFVSQLVSPTTVAAAAPAEAATPQRPGRGGGSRRGQHGPL